MEMAAVVGSDVGHAVSMDGLWTVDRTAVIATLCGADGVRGLGELMI